MDGSVGAVEYDPLGRLKRSFSPNPETGELCPTPSTEVYYHDEAAPLAYVELWVNTSQEICGADRWEVGYSYQDGLGRAYADVSPGDKHLGAEAKFPWLLSGLSELNAKGIAVKSCEALPVLSPPVDGPELIGLQYATHDNLSAQVSSVMPHGWNCAHQEFDVWSREILSNVVFEKLSVSFSILV